MSSSFSKYTILSVGAPASPSASSGVSPKTSRGAVLDHDEPQMVIRFSLASG